MPCRASWGVGVYLGDNGKPLSDVTQLVPLAEKVGRREGKLETWGLLVGYGSHTGERLQDASWKAASSDPEALNVEQSTSWKQLHPIFIMIILEDSSFRSQGLRQTQELRHNIRKIFSLSLAPLGVGYLSQDTGHLVSTTALLRISSRA